MTCGIYKIQNRINGDCYVGQSINIEHRWARHKTIGKNYNVNYINIALYKAFYEFGIENFDFSIIEICNKEKLNEREIYWIKYFNSFKNGYNMTLGGQELPTVNKISEEQVLQIIELLKNSQYTQTEIGEKFGLKMRTISDINRGLYYYHKGINYPIREANFVYCKCIKCGKPLTAHRASKTNLCSDCYKKSISPDLPDREKFKEQLRTMTCKSIIEFYGYKDTEIVRKWCKKLNLPLKSEVKNYSDEEWKKL